MKEKAAALQQLTKARIYDQQPFLIKQR